jgi:hypothetical protein
MQIPQELILASAVTLIILAITAVRTARLRAVISTLPIPITILLLGTGGVVNSTHPFSLLLIVLFLIIIWVLHKKFDQNIIVSIAAATTTYIVMGLINQLVIRVPFVVVYGSMVAGWLAWIAWQPLSHIQPHPAPVSMTLTSYAKRGGIVFFLTYLLLGIREHILGASVTFPINSIFTAYIMRDSLLYFINEIVRNFIGIINFFGIIYLMQGHASRLTSFTVAWILCVACIYTVSNYVPRKALVKRAS